METEYSSVKTTVKKEMRKRFSTAEVDLMGC